MTTKDRRFIAVNVGTGDAFFLQRGGFSALIDGGLTKGFPSKFERATHQSGVDVLVCTHNDQDHTNGVLEFLDAGYGVGECWLPATWIEALQGLLAHDRDEVLDQLLDPPDDGDRPLPEQIERTSELISAEEIDTMLEREAERDPEFDNGFLHPIGYGIAVLLNSGRLLVISPQSMDMVVPAARIRKIAISAVRRQIPIKWFDPSVTPANANAKRGPLDVVNAAPVVGIRRSRLSLRNVIRLTQVNRDSLVLYSPPDEVAPGVLFSADSGFGFQAALPVSSGMIVTAPHHGSADSENIAAYDRLRTECCGELWETLTWVRSDRVKRMGQPRPCDRYLKQRKRFCTGCRGTGTRGQDVVLVGGAGAWSSMGSPPCRCTRP